jgi:hypothetical protein
MTYKSTVLQDGPTVYYAFDDLSGTLTNLGSSGGSATVYAGVYRVAGPIPGDPDGNAYYLNGAANSYTNQANVAGLSQSDRTFTVEAWVRTTALNVSVFAPSGSYWFSINGDGHPWSDGIGGGAITAVTSVSDGKWHHAVLVSDTSGRQIYVDGVLSANAPAATTNPLNTATINVNSPGGSYVYSGAIDECAMYPTALSANRVLEHYNAGITAPGGGGATPAPFRGWGVPL